MTRRQIFCSDHLALAETERPDDVPGKLAILDFIL